MGKTQIKIEKYQPQDTVIRKKRREELKDEYLINIKYWYIYIYGHSKYNVTLYINIYNTVV